MTNFHDPLKLPADRTSRIRSALSMDEDCISVGGFAARSGQLQGVAPEQDTQQSNISFASGLNALARLVQLARRDSGLSFEQFAKRLAISEEELQSTEGAITTPEPRVVYAISEGLRVSYQKLLTLAGHKKQRDERLETGLVRFAASSAPMDRLSKTEAQALHEFMDLLHD